MSRARIATIPRVYLTLKGKEMHPELEEVSGSDSYPVRGVCCTVSSPGDISCPSAGRSSLSGAARRPQPLHFEERVLRLHPHWRFAFSRERLILVEHRVNFFDAFVRRETPCPYVTPEKVAVFVPVQRVGGAVKVDVTTFS